MPDTKCILCNLYITSNISERTLPYKVTLENLEKKKLHRKFISTLTLYQHRHLRKFWESVLLITGCCYIRELKCNTNAMWLDGKVDSLSTKSVAIDKSYATNGRQQGVAEHKCIQCFVVIIFGASRYLGDNIIEIRTTKCRIPKNNDFVNYATFHIALEQTYCLW